MNYTKLIKLLYIIDKESLSRWDEPVSGDSYIAMKNGPVLSKTYDLIKGNGADFEQCEWDILFSKGNTHNLILEKPNISCDELSESEMELIKECDIKHKKHSYKDMINIVHDKKSFPEWEDPGNSSVPITLESILKSVGRTEEQIARIKNELQTYKKEQEFLYNNCT